MKTSTIVLFTCLFLFFFITEVKAAETIFQPVASRYSANDAIYKVDHVRLWHLSENNPAAGSSENFCGRQRKVQVHVFDMHGDSGGRSRLNGVIVQVVHWNKEQRTEEFRVTGQAGVDPGVVEFELQERAEVRIFTDVNGRQIVSQTALVTTTPNQIASERLLASGYCQDEASCQAFMAANQCAGSFSWNVVFKRNY